MTHNGWRNYSTWVTAMYLDGNYEGGENTYLDVLDLARQIHEVQDAEDEQRVMADVLRDYVIDQVMPDGGLAGDLMNAALSDVDWDRLAEHKLDEIKETA